jgi:NAD(P)-dependent dehydrogenase (short-subunit alcohol dehydrogenase family)
VDNLVALVTGANKGIGKEIARQLANAGLTVYLGSRDAARGERAAGEMGGDTRSRISREGVAMTEAIYRVALADGSFHLAIGTPEGGPARLVKD